METSELILVLSAIVFCFIFQTIILKTRISESLTSVEEALQKTHHQMESLCEERLKRLSEIFEEHGKTFADAMKEIPSLISHMNQVHAKQKEHENRILHVPSTLEQCEDAPDKPIPTSSTHMKIPWFVLLVSSIIVSLHFIDILRYL